MKKKTRTPRKRTKTARKARPAPPPKLPEVVEYEDSDKLVVFAFRLPRRERDMIHLTAGSARASKFVRAVVMAAVAGDEKAFRKIVKETRWNLE